MLGLSATMNRKDGTSKIFKMFLGEVVFKENRKQDHPVVVRAVEYKIDDAEFNEIVPLTATRVAEATAINLRLVARIVDLSLQVDFQMHSQITAQIVQ